MHLSQGVGEGRVVTAGPHARVSDSVGPSGAHMYVLIKFPGDAATAGPWTTLKIMFLKKKEKKIMF